MRYIKILTWLRGFLVIFLYLVWCSLCSNLFWELLDNGVVKKIAILTLKPRSCQNFNISNVGYSLRKHSFLLALRRRGRFARNVRSYEERGETDVFAGYVGYCGTRSMCLSSSVFIVRPPFPSFIPADAFQRRETLTLRKFNGSCINLLF